MLSKEERLMLISQIEAMLLDLLREERSMNDDTNSQIIVNAIKMIEALQLNIEKEFES